MKLTVSTPLAIVVDGEEIAQLRAEDATGSFGLLPRHADFLTVLTACVLSWRRPDGSERYLAVRGGMLEVQGGQSITVATREAIAGEDLEDLQSRVLAQFREQAEQERTARTDAQKLYVAAIRQICRLLHPETQAPRPSWS
jgi:F-type H+-transporting ATPase subunit epsilon